MQVLVSDLPVLDAHAHVWHRSCRYIAESRYRPDYAAPIGDYLRLLDAHGIERAVLVQGMAVGVGRRSRPPAMRRCAADLTGFHAIQ